MNFVNHCQACSRKQSTSKGSLIRETDSSNTEAADNLVAKQEMQTYSRFAELKNKQEERQ